MMIIINIKSNGHYRKVINSRFSEEYSTWLAQVIYATWLGRMEMWQGRQSADLINCHRLSSPVDRPSSSSPSNDNRHVASVNIALLVTTIFSRKKHKHLSSSHLTKFTCLSLFRKSLNKTLIITLITVKWHFHKTPGVACLNITASVVQQMVRLRPAEALWAKPWVFPEQATGNLSNGHLDNYMYSLTSNSWGTIIKAQKLKELHCHTASKCVITQPASVSSHGQQVCHQPQMWLT